MSYSMFLDDIRDANLYYPNQDMVVCRDFKSACEYVIENGIPAFVSFDHDLGDVSEDEKTGYSLLSFLLIICLIIILKNRLSTLFTVVILLVKLILKHT